MVVGVTGGIGSGKSTVTNCFKQLNNVVVYIADEEAKKLMNTAPLLIQKIKNQFGEEAYNGNQLNRKYIADQVFNNPEKLAQLNSIVHPEVHKHFSEFVASHKQTIILYENAILFEIGSDRFCDIVITVSTPEKERIQRVMKRDHSSEKEVIDRMKNQWRDEKKIALSNYVIVNNHIESLTSQVKQIHNILTKKMDSF
jgi:dephospho-CoA kinase